MNIMLASVYERTREIVISRAVGTTRMDIVLYFLAESVILTSIGGILGIVLDIISSHFIASIGQWQVMISTWAVLIPIFMVILVGIFLGLYPAAQASRMDTIKALRHD